MGRRARFISPAAESRSVCYHAGDRVNGLLFLLKDRKTKEKFIQMMRMHEAYTDVRVLSYVIMDNHFHLLLEVPPKKKGAPVPMSDEVFLEKIKAFNSAEYYKDIKQMLGRLRESGADAAAEEIKAKHTCRMRDLSCFMQGLKRRFSQWYNKTHNRTGTLWEGRFKSIIVQDGYACRVMSSYIDLNPVRAGMVERPEDYRWSSYGEAMKPSLGEKSDYWRAKAREGLCRVMQLNRETGGRTPADESEVLWERQGAEWYRMMLYADGEEVFVRKPKEGVVGGESVSVRKGFQRKDVEKVLSQGGKLSFGEALRCKIRYFSDGMVFGTKDFLNDLFKETKERFGEKRESGARPMREIDWKEKEEGRLYSMRALRKDAVG
jgi:REP element-mobilizing transposase RayT